MLTQHLGQEPAFRCFASKRLEDLPAGNTLHKMQTVRISTCTIRVDNNTLSFMLSVERYQLPMLCFVLPT